MTASILDVRDVSFRYDQAWIVDHVSLQISKQDFIGLIGPNGGGKTTLLKLVLGLLQPEKGSIHLFGIQPRFASHQVGYVPQHIHIDPQFPIAVNNVVQMGLLHGIHSWFSFAGQQEKIDRALEKVSMLEYRKRPFRELSGGQRQRVLIARALVSSPQLLIMDEPTANVDSLSQQQIYELLHDINEHCAIILVSHDVGVVTAHVTKVACMNRNLVMHQANEITDTDLQNMYHTHIHVVDHCHVLPAQAGDQT